jgi:histidyl-tRNA synthetase
MLVRFLSEVGVSEVEVLVNSLGSGDTRERYRAALVSYLEPHRSELSEDSQRRLESNPLRVLDSKSPADQAVAGDAPSILEHLSAEDQAHFDGLLATLEALGVPHAIDSRIVRGLDYYTRTLFEVKDRSGKLGAQDTICGGGRYDELVQTLGGPPTPAIGFAIGVERLLMVAEPGGADASLDAFVVVTSPDLRGPACVLLRDLRAAGLSVDADLRGTSVKSQMRRADKSGVRVAVLLGTDELARGTVTVRDLAAKSQREVALPHVAAHVREVHPEGGA